MRRHLRRSVPLLLSLFTKPMSVFRCLTLQYNPDMYAHRTTPDHPIPNRHQPQTQQMYQIPQFLFYPKNPFIVILHFYLPLHTKGILALSAPHTAASTISSAATYFCSTISMISSAVFSQPRRLLSINIFLV